jgi:hypothetical protein
MPFPLCHCHPNLFRKHRPSFKSPCYYDVCSTTTKHYLTALPYHFLNKPIHGHSSQCWVESLLAEFIIIPSFSSLTEHSSPTVGPGCFHTSKPDYPIAQYPFVAFLSCLFASHQIECHAPLNRSQRCNDLEVPLLAGKPTWIRLRRVHTLPATI